MVRNNDILQPQAMIRLDLSETLNASANTAAPQQLMPHADPWLHADMLVPGVDRDFGGSQTATEGSQEP